MEEYNAICKVCHHPFKKTDRDVCNECLLNDELWDIE